MKTKEQEKKSTDASKVESNEQLLEIKQFFYAIFCNLLYVLIFIPIIYATIHIPGYDTESKIFKKIYSRDNHYTTVLSFGKLALWMIMMSTGFMFVNKVNLMNQRKTFVKGRDGTYRDFIILMCISIIIYFIAPILSLRSKWDMSRNIYFNALFKEDIDEINRYPD